MPKSPPSQSNGHDLGFEMSITDWGDLPGANLPPLEDEDGYELDFAWLDDIDKGIISLSRMLEFQLIPLVADDCYMTLNDSNPSKSLDFGHDGYTASVTSWHELLQMTAPDDKCGVVFVRGDFPDGADSILARTQRRNQKGTWGLGIRIDENAEYVLENTSAQGMINLRWPCTRLNLIRKDKLLGSVPFGSYTICSFIKNGILYQIARVPASCPPSSVSSSSNGSRPSSTARLHSPPGLTLPVDVGGLLRIGCSSSVAPNLGGPPIPLFDNYTTLEDSLRPWMLASVSERHQRRLEMRLWINRQPIALNRHHCSGARLDRTNPNAQNDYHDEIAKLHVIYPVQMLENKPITIITAFSFVHSSTSPNFLAVPAISSSEVQDYLGVTESSLYAPYRLWSAAMSQAHGRESFELNTIGRGVEQILGVSAVPVNRQISPTDLDRANGRPRARSDSNPPAKENGHISSHDSSKPIASTKSKVSRNHRHSTALPAQCEDFDLGIALIQNIITPQRVDLPSTFWQVRLLIKALQYLDTRQPLSPNSDVIELKKRHYARMHKQYKNQLLATLRGVAKWIFHIIYEIGPQNRPNPPTGILCSDVIQNPQRRPCDLRAFADILTQQDHKQPDQLGQELRPRGHRWYCAVIVWYMLKQYPPVFKDKATWDQLWEALPVFDSIKNHEKLGVASYVDDSTLCLIRWYHSHCFTQICRYLETVNPSKLLSLDIDLDKHKKWAKNWQVKAEKSLRLFGQGRLIHQPLNHEVVHLALLTNEIGICNAPITQQSKSCYSLAFDSIQDRQETSSLNPGRPSVIRWDKHDMRSAMPRPAPWELSCLEHHVPSGCPGNNDCVEACKQFLLSDFTFMSSWDQSRADSAAQWWNVTTSSIICATILEQQQQRSRNPSMDFENEPSKRVSFANIDASALIITKENESIESIPDSIKRSQTPKSMADVPETEQGIFTKEGTKRFFELLRGQSKSKDEPEGFGWRELRPKNLYHADTIVQSLEDTPLVFELKQTRDIGIRPNVLKYFKKHNLSLPNWSLDTIKQAIPPVKLLHMSCFDLALKTSSHHNPEIGISSQKGAIDKNFWPQVKQCMGDRVDWSRLRLLYFLGKVERHPKFQDLDLKSKVLLQDTFGRTQILAAYQTSLFNVLNDSMVDLGTKYRIIFIRKITPVILQAMVYMWHTDALDTFDDHLGLVSQSSNSHNQSANGLGVVWTTTITISHWRLQDEAENILYRIEDDTGKAKTKTTRCDQPSGFTRYFRKAKKQITEDDQELALTTDFPPRTVEDNRNVSQGGQTQLSTIRELSISLVITGDEMGRSWTCSIVSEVIDEEAVLQYTNKITNILQMFIHQQFSGRALSFLLLLGHMCESLSKECEKFTEELDKIMGMDPMVLLKGLEWHKSDVALKKLKEMLWGLEALRVFSDKLERALNEIKDIKAEMDKELKRGEELRHKDMNREIEKVKETYEKRFNRLENSSISIRQRIDQSTRLREGITSVLGVEQNENISMLTWVTIAYLPLSFIAGAFSMGHNIVPNNAGWATFGWLIVVFVLVTILFALSLQVIIGRLRRVGKFIDRIFTRNKPRTTAVEVLESSTSATDFAKAKSGGLRSRIKSLQKRVLDEETGDGES